MLRADGGPNPISGWLLLAANINSTNNGDNGQNYAIIIDDGGYDMKSIEVKDVYQLQGRASITVPEDAALDYIVALLGHESRFQGIFFVNSHNKFSGMISRFDLARLFRLNSESRKEEILGEFIRTAHVKKAKDLQYREMQSFSVKETDTLQSALDLMLSYEQDIIPVLDDQGAVLGDLSLSEILLKSLEVDTNSSFIS
jgi:CBS domain-containing protein